MRRKSSAGYCPLSPRAECRRYGRLLRRNKVETPTSRYRRCADSDLVRDPGRQNRGVAGATQTTPTSPKASTGKPSNAMPICAIVSQLRGALCSCNKSTRGAPSRLLRITFRISGRFPDQWLLRPLPPKPRFLASVDPKSASHIALTNDRRDHELEAHSSAPARSISPAIPRPHPRPFPRRNYDRAKG